MTLSKLALQSASMEQLMGHAMAVVTRTLDLERAAIFELQPDEKNLVMKYAHGWPEEMIGLAVLDVSTDSQVAQTLSTGQPGIVADFDEERFFEPPPFLVSEKLVSSATVLLDSPDRSFGILMLNSHQPRTYSMEDRRFLLAVAELLELAIGQIQQRQIDALQVDAYQFFQRDLPMQTKLTQLCQRIEMILGTGQCAVMLFEQSTHRIRLGAGPSLNAELAEAIDSIQTGHSEDVEAIAKHHGIRACWSTPIFIKPGLSVGICAILHQTDAKPTSFELHILEIAAQLVAAVVRQARKQWHMKKTEKSQKTLETQVADRTCQLQNASEKLQHEVSQRRLAEDQARGGEERYRDLFDKSNDLILIITPEGAIRFVNQTWQQAIGYTQSEIRRLSAYDTIHPQCRSQWTELFRRVGAGESLGNIQTRLFTREGKTIAAEGSLSPVVQHGQVTSISVIFRDITESKRAEEEQEKFASLVQCSSDSIVMATQLGQVRFINNAGRELLGFEQDESVTNLHLSDLYSTQTWETLSQIALPAINEVGQWEGEGEVTHRQDHESIDVHISTFLVRHPKTNEPLCIATVQRDIRQRKEVDRVKDELITTVSHELRTPLTSLRGYAELLLSRDYDKEKQERFLNIIHDETQRLNKLINDFLDIRRMESGSQSYELKSLDLRSLIEQVVKTFQQNKRPVSWEVQLPSELPLVYADRDRIWQVLSNLLSNALKFAPPQSTVSLGARQQGSSVVCWVTDEGSGIPKYEQASLFEKFYRTAISEENKLPGSGLGLAIVKEIIDAHEGRVWLTSELDKGTTFYFSLFTVGTDR